MKKIVAVNTSPRTTWNTAAMVREAAKGAEAQGAEIVYFDLYKAMRKRNSMIRLDIHR